MLNFRRKSRPEPKAPSGRGRLPRGGRVILAVAALTLFASAAAIHFLYGALDRRYQAFWGLDNREAQAPSPLPETELAALAGQLIMIGFDGQSLDGRRMDALRRAITQGRAGGVLLLEKNIASPAQTRLLTSALQDAANAGRQPPLLIAVDQEGGEVQRLNARNGHARAALPAAKSVAEKCTPQQALEVYRAAACALREAGINVNLGPVGDLDIAGNKNPIIGARRRSYAAEANLVIAYGAAFIEAHRGAGLGTSVKHFPGHGGSLTDSHDGLTDITASFRPAELEPFRTLAGTDAAGPADMVMTGHLHHAGYMDAGEPATFSSRLLRDMLRDEIGFRGVVISDDLEMGAIRERYGLNEAMLRAINAGVDLVIVSNTRLRDPALIDRLHQALTAAVKPDCPPASEASCIPGSRLREAHNRVMALKAELSLRRSQTAGACGPAPPRNLFASLCTGRPERPPEPKSWWSWFAG